MQHCLRTIIYTTSLIFAVASYISSSAMSSTTIRLLTPEQVIEVQQFAVGATACAALGYGTYLILSFRAMYVLIRRGLWESRPRCVLLAAVLMMFIATTTVFVGDIGIALNQVRFFGENPYPTGPRSFDHSNIVRSVASRILVLLSDAIIVWRAWVICNRRALKIILSCCMLGALVGTLFEGIKVLKSLAAGRPSETMAVFLSMMLPILTTNLVATLAIGHKAWVYRRTVRNNPSVISVSTEAHNKVFLLFLESGLLYLVVWALDTTLGFIPSANLAYTYVDITVSYLLAMYPAVIIILVTQRTPLLEDQIHVPSNTQIHMISTPLRPTAPSIRSTVVNIGFESEVVNTGFETEPKRLHMLV
ncbi:hypothetical protein C8J56DRAFT_951392 [Mycena floridula]|nr:hypothetical protein C8J56DRAFT_951392 [Mycena floridula]